MPDRELIRETDWSREYCLGPNTFLFESKFAEGLEVAAAYVREHWSDWSPSQQLDFVNAFIWKPHLTDQDHLIVTYLLDSDSQVVLDTVAYLLPRYADRERAVSFLLDRISSGAFCVGNCYQALEVIGDPRAIPPLRLRYERYRNELSPLERLGLHSEFADYQHCCRALWKLDGSAEYERALEELLLHPDPGIRRCSFYLLHDRWPEPGWNP